ncbi:hypothetical protein EYB26_003886 [Talaromyces marneffei]|uniref:G domain-containing protein n=1 Tax=Talaromyces marneffei (strain ATCC 18224 / CBS 334.59 / QM 7333) TaxID=441960 RepID=B6QDK9_TALMQ|nr:uncharacterized protein EYB26_003886 [Talaromyces marneffei]EEA23795.1 conserved hypothetical protein [Talaromyces marneffei ATCC 18224]QGA16219.1 hypothetical protein EYB26_003886 [Talaromyces marneffei]
MYAPPHNSPPVPVQHRKILVEETSVAPREDTDSAIPPLPPTSISLHADTLPISCPGCGAYAQTIDSNEPGFYSRTRKKAKQLWHKKQQAIVKEQRAISSQDGEGTDDGATGSDPLDKAETTTQDLQDESTFLAATEYIQSTAQYTQICDRCHDLLHHNKGVSIPSPSIDSIAAYLEESPHRINRVYHIIDAADFPMSLIPNIYEALDLQDQRSRNRRSKTEKYKYGKRMTTINFVITRADLLAATKDQVDSLMKRIREIILKKLDMSREDVRLGNVHMISAHRGWWTSQVKEEIRQHGGGVWIVGKANVGKSSFIESCFPKDSKNLDKIAQLLESRKLENSLKSSNNETPEATPFLDPDALLPPAPREELYPTLPVVSSLPGTTVGPIRIPFGRGHGEMIDLPGLDRGTLQDFMLDEHKPDLIMTKRINPSEQLSIRDRQSLLIGGGLIRITPKDVPEDFTILAACFVPLETHVTRTEKAIEIQSGVRKYNTGGGDRGNSVIKPEHLGEEATTIRSAGTFTLSTDVTLNHLPSMIKKKWEDHGIRPNLDTLPYRVYSTDILIEGCGWIELTCQVRTRRYEAEHDLPRIEVFTPLGKHVAARPPLETWNFIRDKRKAEKRKRFTSGAHRPRRGNISHKKRTLHGGKGA